MVDIYGFNSLSSISERHARAKLLSYLDYYEWVDQFILSKSDLKWLRCGQKIVVVKSGHVAKHGL